MPPSHEATRSPHPPIRTAKRVESSNLAHFGLPPGERFACAECMTDSSTAPQVGVIMGSTSDWSTMKHVTDVLDQFEVPYEKQVVSAHRTPEKLFKYAESAAERGLKCIIAGAGGAAHLPGMVAAMTPLPVLGVPVESAALKGMDSLLSIVQMPGGIPVATFAIGKAGARNAGLYAVAILALGDADLAGRLSAFRHEQTAAVMRAKLD